jgi:hypothetical protein
MRSPDSTSAARRSQGDDYDSRFTEQRGTRASRGKGREVTEGFSTEPARSQALPPHRDHRPAPRASRLNDRWTTDRLSEGQEDNRAERRSGNLRNPLVRRAPYLYEDDPLRQQFAQQLKHEPPQTRRSSRLQTSEDEEEY